MIKINSISIINQKNRDSQPVFGYFVSFLYESVPTLSKVAIDLFKIMILNLTISITDRSLYRRTTNRTSK